MTLSKGASGQQVIRLQAGLQKAGFDLPQYGIDGKFGSETQSAVMKAQRRYSLPVTGEAGPTLLSKLGVSNAQINMKTDKKAMLTKAVLAGIAIGALIVIAKKMRNR